LIRSETRIISLSLLFTTPVSKARIKNARTLHEHALGEDQWLFSGMSSVYFSWRSSTEHLLFGLSKKVPHYPKPMAGFQTTDSLKLIQSGSLCLRWHQ